MARRDGRLSDAERVQLLRATHDAIALQRAGVEAVEMVMWQTASFFYETGTAVEVIADALDVSVPTFYRRLREVRGH